MNLSAPFIRRPVATTLLTIGVTLVGAVAFRFLPVASLPQVEFPTIQVSAELPGASPEVMATAVAAPLERQFARIAGVTEMTSTSSLGSTGITLQFDLNRNIDGAARDVQDRLKQAAASGKTIFMSTHLLDMAEKVCTRVGIIHRGELVATGSLEELRAGVDENASLEKVFLAVTEENATQASNP